MTDDRRSDLAFAAGMVFIAVLCGGVVWALFTLGG